MTHEQLSNKGPGLPRNLGKQIWAALTDAFLPIDSGVTGFKRPALQVNQASTVYSTEVKNELYLSKGQGSAISPGTLPILELIEMEMKIRLEWLSH
jgi:hypothetical protein